MVEHNVHDVNTRRAPTHIQSVSRAARILMAIARAPGGCAASQVAAEVGVSLPTAYHLLNTLLAEGLLAKSPGRRYHLGPRIGELADAFLDVLNPPQYLVAHLHQLAQETGETSYLSSWRHDEIVVLACVEGEWAVRVAGLHRGTAGFSHARASGKVLLAFATEGVRERYLKSARFEALTPRTIVSPDEFEAELEYVRERGYALDDGEFREDVSCASGPVHVGESVVAALTLSAPRDRFEKRRGELVSTLMRVCAEASVRSEPRSIRTGKQR